jgi:hypothetical protein
MIVCLSFSASKGIFGQVSKSCVCVSNVEICCCKTGEMDKKIQISWRNENSEQLSKDILEWKPSQIVRMYLWVLSICISTPFQMLII